jgi:predicted ATPase
MEKLIRFYENQIKSCTDIRERLKKKIYHLGTIRLLWVVGMLVTLWLCQNESWMVWGGIILAFALPFIALMVYHAKLFDKKAYAESMLQLNTNELKGIDYDFSAFDGAPELTDAQHSFSLDLDLFGDQSLFQSLNRTVTSVGKSCLSTWFTQPLTNKTDILYRQHAIQEMTDKTMFRQHFYVTGISQEKNRKDILQLKSLTDRSYVVFSQSLLWKTLIWLMPACWLALLAGMLWAGVPFGAFAIMFCVSFLVANLRGKTIHTLYKSVDKMEKLLLTYSHLMKQIEQESFQSDWLKETQHLLATQEVRASQAIKRLSRIIGALDQRFSIAGLLLNVFYLRDTRQAILLEQWLKTNATHFDAWFESLSRIDALCSLSGFAFNHPDYIYPTIADTYFCMEGKSLGHPLLDRRRCVQNDINISKTPYFSVITGANMAGKSTYLRTIGINFLLACMGAPVCAESLTVYPAHLVTSLRTADSLSANESYFYAELKRLKMIIDRLNAGEELFIILDEILKGTNSKDKQKGSLALMRQLIAKKACGIIATHDLLLGALEQDFPNEIKNYHFEADITNDELSFTYRLREGIAQNMNASFLMKKMGITL